MPNATHPRRFLFVLWDGGGNVPPQLALVRQLIARGHAVRVLAPRVLEARIAATGGQFVPYQQAPEHESAVPTCDLLQDWKAATPLGAAAQVRDRVMVGPSLAFAHDVLAALDEEPADVVVPDYMLLGAYLGAERAGLPTAALIHHIYPLPAPGLPPFGLGLQPARGAVGRLRDATFRRLFVRFYNARLPRLNAARTALSLAPLPSVFDLFARLDRALVLTSQSFDFPASALPDNVCYVGVPLDEFTAEPGWAGLWAADDARRLVVVSFSTTYQRQEKMIRRVIEALGTLPVRALVTTGPAITPTTFAPPPNVVVRDYIPHQHVFPQADLVITHGGHGTVMTALACGVPVLCLPMGRDQGDVAARVVGHGVGLRLSSGAGPTTLSRTVRRILATPSFGEAARRLARVIVDEAREEHAIAQLEALAGAAHPQSVPLTTP